MTLKPSAEIAREILGQLWALLNLPRIADATKEIGATTIISRIRAWLSRHEPEYDGPTYRFWGSPPHLDWPLPSERMTNREAAERKSEKRSEPK